MIVFSIVLPTYNRAHFLPIAINSLLKQDNASWELLIIDDGSTDNTKEVVEDFIKRDDRIRYLYQDNAERSAARNKGIENAKGDFVCFLDSDDFFSPNHLSSFENLILQQKEVAGLYFSGYSVNNADASPQYYDTRGKSDVDFIFLNPLATPRACIAKTILEKNTFDVNLNVGEDFNLWARCAEDYPVFYHQTKSFIQVEHPNRSINFDNLGYQNLATLKYTLKQLAGKKLSKKVLQTKYQRIYFNIAMAAIKNRQRGLGIKFLAKSLWGGLDLDKRRFKINILLRLIGGQSFAKIDQILK